MNTYLYNQKGYIALISAVIISFILIGLTFSVSSAGYFSRGNVATSEYKRISLGLAESCVNLALLRVAQNYNYAPLPAGDTIAVGAQDCLIKSVTYGPELAGRKGAYIVAQADYQGSFSNMKIVATVASSTYSSISKATLTVQVLVTNDSGGMKQPLDFTVNIAGGNPTLSTFLGDATGITVVVDAGVTVNESISNYFGYTPSYSPLCNSTLSVGMHATCTIYLNDPATTATLTLIANVKNDNGGTKTPSNFPLFIDGTLVTTGIATTGLAPGLHTASVSSSVGYTASNWGYDCLGNGTITLLAGENKTCIINFDDTPPPAPACADTMVMIDRTGSLSSSDLAAERTATKALLDLYGKIATPPQVGIGRFGGASGAIADIIGNLTSNYGSSSIVGYSANLPPSIIGSRSSWLNGIGAFDQDAQYAFSSTQAQQEIYKGFNFGLGASTAITGIEVTVTGVGEAAPVNINTANIFPLSVGAPNSNQWIGSSTNAGKTAAMSSSDGSGTYVSSATANNSQAFVFPNISVPPTAIINSVALYAVAASPTLGGTFRLRVENTNNTVASTSQLISPKTTYGAALWMMNINPITNLPWTNAEVASLPVRFGMTKVNTTAVRVTQLYVVVNYRYFPTTLFPVGVNMSWNNGTSWTNTTATTSIKLTNTENTFVLGSGTSTWGRAWTGGDISDTNFAIRFTNNATSGDTVSINSVKVKVYYSGETGLYSAIDSNIITTSSGGTDINSGIAVGNGEVSGARHDITKAKVLIILSDGLPTSPSNDQNYVLTAADTAKQSGTVVYFIHFGSGSGNDLSAKISSGTTTVAGHQLGSKNDAGSATVVSQALAYIENNDKDNFFISPTFTQLQTIFEQVGTAVCPAAGAVSTPPPTTGQLVVITHMVNDNGGTKQPSDFTMQLSGSGLNPSINNFVGVDAPGVSVTVSSTTPGGYSVVELGFAGYVPTYGAGCSGNIAGGETRTCTVTNNDNAPAPPPPPPPPPNIDIGPWQETTTASPGP